MEEKIILAIVSACIILVVLLILSHVDVGKVDVVYLWVDSYDPERTLFERVYQIEQKETKFRFNENEEIRFSLRSIYAFLPWVHNIYVVVKDGQCPPFLNLNHPQIHLVNHSQILPEQDLPVFNSMAIEKYIHKIPNLQEKYIYFNDDFFVCAPCSKVDFFPNGLPAVNVHVKNYIIKNQNYSIPALPYTYSQLLEYNNIIGRELFHSKLNLSQPHTPSPCYKPWEYEFEHILNSSQYNNLSKFRTNHNLSINNHLRTFFYLTKRARRVYWDDGYVEVLGNSCQIKFPNSVFMCVNKVGDNCRHALKAKLNELFPEKCPYEKE